MTREDIDYVIGYINATDDGTWDSEDDLADFVIDQLYEEFGEEVVGLVEQAMAERRAG